MFESLRHKRVLLTGASGGIGTSIARLFAQHGAALGLHYHQSKREAEQLQEDIVNGGGQAECFQADLRDPSACRDLVQAFLAGFQGLDVLINNAGAVFSTVHFSELDAESWDQTLALNARAPFVLAREAFAHMKTHGGGKIINISSVAAKYGGSATSLHYGAAKAALDAVTVGLARAGAPHNILVNSIRPGFVETAFHRKMGRTDVEARIDLIPLKRAGQPLDVARIALFLASEAGDYITGEIITVSGGD